ncbi:putative transcriptional regulator [Actinacidiphila reveromycinica]|uniref:Putative transcriptional regulator n=1 Tax=Actinacidiphila reveromycinica TaxID=659352 RepID=A0A7U3UUN9_9ACTN|nr:hypothetical protein [Streptomyces sp. SN-593]BBA99089.1 putative transcriptional regulator [Streptomyces sp. SN-593]
MTDDDSAGTAAADRADWLAVRAHLRLNRHQLSISARHCYGGAPTVEDTALLTRPEWLPERPLEMDAVRTEWDDTPASPGRDAALRRVAQDSGLLPRRDDVGRFPSYSAAMRELARPAVFEDRFTYQLRHADLTGGPDRSCMRFGAGSYFDGIDLGEACAHEYAASVMRLGRATPRHAAPPRATPLRDALGGPCRPDDRPSNLAVATLVLRHDPATGHACFPLHWRDPAKVGQAGGLYMVVPVGIFQPAGTGPHSRVNDFSVWRCVLREFAEELLGEPEDPGTAEPIDYGTWPVAARLDRERTRRRIRTYVLGMGTDALTLATDLLTVMVIDAELWDELARRMSGTNAEGRLVTTGETEAPRLFRFDEAEIHRLVTELPLETAGAALLRLAWRHRRDLLG